MLLSKAPSNVRFSATAVSTAPKSSQRVLSVRVIHMAVPVLKKRDGVLDSLLRRIVKVFC